MWTLLVIAATVAAVGYVAYKYPATWNWALAIGVAKTNEVFDAAKNAVKK